MKKTILMVDNNKINILIYRRFLAEICDTILSAESGLVALEILESQKIDLVLVAIQMPIMNGYQLTAHIRSANNDSRWVPIIALSTYCPHHCVSWIIDDCLLLPVSKDRLIEKVRHHLYPPT